MSIRKKEGVGGCHDIFRFSEYSIRRILDYETNTGVSDILYILFTTCTLLCVKQISKKIFAYANIFLH